MRLASILFASSFTLVVATGWAHLDAADDGDGPAEKPVVQQLSLDGKRVTATLDRGRVPAGESVTLTLAAVDPGLAGRELPVRVMAESGSRMSRVTPPPRQLTASTVRLGSEPVTLSFALPGPGRPGADPLNLAGQATRYSIEVGEGGDRIALPAFAYQPEAFHLTLEAPGPVRVGKPVDVAVRVKSLAREPLRDLTVGASSPLFVVDEPARLATLDPGAEVVLHLRGRGIPRDDAPPMIYAYGTAARGGTTATTVELDLQRGTLSEVTAPLGLVAGLY